VAELALRIASLNISGGEKSFEEFPQSSQKSRQEALELLIRQLDADVLCLQEVSEYIDADGITRGLMDVIHKAGDYDYSFYGETVSMVTHLQVKKQAMVTGIFNDWWDWSKGNAILSRIPFVRLSDPKRPALPRNIPLYQPLSYEGNRDTDPRFTLLTRLKDAPFPFLATLHLTTLVGERGRDASAEKKEQAHQLRNQQILRFLDLVGEHILGMNQPLILAGDFNAASDEFCIAQLLEAEHGFVRLVPENEGPSHPEYAEPIDHILFFPQERLLDYHCWIESSGLSRRASDHLPVVVDLRIK
jgi:endonuclease/exonuclease/phosphatase family metal-dependent hydrolase